MSHTYSATSGTSGTSGTSAIAEIRLDLDSYPRLRSSLQYILRSDGSIYIGDARSGYEVDSLIFLQILRSCTGTQTLREIADRISTTGPVTTFFEELGRLGVLEFLPRSTSEPSRQQHLLNISERLEIERSLITHRGTDEHMDGGVREIVERSDLAIHIHGDTRVARNLLALLSASGFSNVTLELPVRCAPLLHPRDLNGLTVTSDDLGKSKALHHKEIARLALFDSAHFSSLSEGQSGQSDQSDLLVIATAGANAEEIQAWQSGHIRHLAISEVIAQAVEISPIIDPGVGPCLHCIALHRRDALPLDLSSLVTTRQDHELPAISAALVAAQIAALVTNYSADRKNFLENSLRAERYRRRSYLINLLEPTDPIEVRKWSFHPECGCVDVRRRALPR